MPTVPDFTTYDMSRLMRKLATNFGSKKDLDAKADLWYERLQHYPLAVVERVVNRLLDGDSKFFPQVGQAIAIARELAPDVIRGDNTLAAALRAWERDPWAGIGSLDDDRQDCTSAPCPICGSVIRFSDRGAVIVHDSRRHREAGVSYSNIGHPEWFQLGPPVQLAPEPHPPGPLPKETAA